MPKNQPQAAVNESYHHGDLHNALIIAAAELIDESGSADIAMVDAARRAGVSSAAPYRHFKDRDELLLGVARLGFFALDQELAQVDMQYDKGSVECIIALGKCYIGFVTARPAFFSIMWGEHGHNPLHNRDEAYTQQLSNAFWRLVGHVEQWCRSEGIADSKALDITMTLWSIGMGLCHLTFNHQLEKFAPQVDPYQLLDDSGRAYLRGLTQTI